MKPILQYISASRRNDFPRFHYRRFFDSWKQGWITYDGGYGRSYTVSLMREHVMGYLFWSKDFRPFISHPLFQSFFEENNAVFHFTINNMPLLEPDVPPLKQRLETLELLCRLVGPERVSWRYDPLCKYETSSGKQVMNIKPFFDILPVVRAAGVTRCYFSFITTYSKLSRRSVRFWPFSDEEKRASAQEMQDAASGQGVVLYNCCNPEVLSLVPGIQKACCVDESVLRQTDRFGRHKQLRIKPTREGCGCFESRDIGSYTPACPHGCIYCYANPAL